MPEFYYPWGYASYMRINPDDLLKLDRELHRRTTPSGGELRAKPRSTNVVVCFCADGSLHLVWPCNDQLPVTFAGSPVCAPVPLTDRPVDDNMRMSGLS